jgi:hypothetical protein
MFASGILDVAIGLMLLYLLLSLVCTAINEFIESRLKRRASDLERGIRNLLSDDDGKGLAGQVYGHPLVRGLFSGDYDANEIEDGRYANGSNLPSYIPARVFTLALMDVVAPATAGGATALQPMRDAIEKLPNSDVRRALTDLIDAAGDDAAAARANIEEWFDSAMDRVSGWYRRRSQSISFVVGLALAVAVNADSLAVANSLSLDAALRQSLVTAAQGYAQAATAGDAKPDPVSPLEPCQKDRTSSECRIATNLREIAKLGLPLGWDSADARRVPPNVLSWAGFFAWGGKLVGWLLTAFAISLGAPFWFDLLNRMMVVRGTVKPREKSPEEPSADR